MSSRSVLPKILSVFYLFALFNLVAQEEWLYAPNANTTPINQLKASGNACGPAALLNASQMGEKKWQASFAAIPGQNDRNRILSLIKKYGIVRSAHIPTRLRYNSNKGINVADLTDMANDMRVSRWQPKLNYQLLFRDERTPSQRQLEETHALLRKSLKKGYPPVLHLQRVARRHFKRSQQIIWMPVKSHFVVLTGLPDRIPRGSTSFPVTYLDPWGGRHLRGIIRVPKAEFRALPVISGHDVNNAISPNLVAEFPKSRVGLSLVGKNEASALTLASAIGDF